MVATNFNEKLFFLHAIMRNAVFGGEMEVITIPFI